MDENIIAVVQDESKGAPSTSSVSIVRVGSDKAQYDLYFTDRRIVAATIFSQSDISQLGPVAVYESAFKWKKTRQEKRDSYKGKTPGEILSMHKDSFELPYDKIKSAQIKKGLAGAKIIAEVEWQGQIENVKLKIPKKRAGEVKEILQTKIPGSVS